MRAVGFLLISSGVILLAAIIFAVLRERDHKRVVQALNEQLNQQREDFRGLLDRLYERKNLPPSDVSMSELFNSRVAAAEQQRVERRNGGPLRHSPGRIGPVDSAVLQMAIDLKREQSDEPAA